MGQFATHMNIVNGSSHQITIHAYVHGVKSNSHTTYTTTIGAGCTGLITLSRSEPGEYHVDWVAHYKHGHHASFRTQIANQNVTQTMHCTDQAVFIDGRQVGTLAHGAPQPHKHHNPAAEFGKREVAASMLPRGAVIQLVSFKTGKNVRVCKNGTMDAQGAPNGPFTRFVVDPSKDGFLRLRSEKVPEFFLSHKGSSGKGGAHCNFKAYMTAPNRYVLRSPDDQKGLGFNIDGVANPGEKVGLGEGASFNINFCDVHVPQHHHAPPPHGQGHHHHVPPPHGQHHPPPPHGQHVPPPHGQVYPPPPHGQHVPPPHGQVYPPPPQHQPHHVPPPHGGHHPPPPHGQGQGHGHMHPLLAPGSQLFLRSESSGNNVCLPGTDDMNANGKTGARARFVVSPSPRGYLRFQLVADPSIFVSLACRSGKGGEQCEFIAQPTGRPNEFHFRSIDNKRGLGFNPNGTPQPSEQTGTGRNGTFYIFTK